MGSFRLPGLAPAPDRRPPQPGCFTLGAIAATKILFQLVKFQVYAQANDSSITIVCCGAVSDCGNLIKITRLAAPSPLYATLPRSREHFHGAPAHHGTFSFLVPNAVHRHVNQ